MTRATANMKVYARKAGPSAASPPPPLPAPHIQASFILLRYLVLQNGSLGCNILFLWKGQLLVFLVLFRAM